MVIDLATIDFSEPAVLLLKNLDGTPLCALGDALDVSATFNYNEVSELTFTIPAQVNGQPVAYYDLVVGMRIVDWVGVGQFILNNPQVTTDGVREVKECKAYSLEYELNYKTIFLDEGTYKFWDIDATKQPETILGILCSELPSWHIGTVDIDLTLKYRTLSVENATVYGCIKDTLQETYQCIFDFDTYSRAINVRSVNSIVRSRPVYLSLDNVVKEVQVQENTDDLCTCLDVNGAADVDIRSVNPMGNNKLYNLDYFMQASYFSADMIAKWESWKATYETKKEAYYQLTIDKVMKESRLEAERAEATELSGELSSLEALMATYVELLAVGDDATISEKLEDVKAKIDAKKAEQTAQEAVIQGLMADIEALYAQQVQVNQACSFSAFFTSEELLVLDRYMKYGTISEESFVYKEVGSYVTDDQTIKGGGVQGTLVSTSLESVTSGDKVFYHVFDGALNLSYTDTDNQSVVLSASVQQGAIESGGSDNLITAHLGSGTLTRGDTVASFQTACVTLILGAVTFAVSSTTADEVTTSTVSITPAASAATRLYFSRDTSEFERRSVEWDLMEYGEQCLFDLCSPSYTFQIESVNFLALSDFVAFRNQLTLGDKVYVELSEGKIYQPILIGVSVSLDDMTSFTLTFGDKYASNDSSFKLVDLLAESVSMGKNVSANKKSYAAFVDSGASNSVRQFMKNALDIAKNALMNSSGQAFRADQSGIHLLKYADASNSTYSPEQTWVINNGIYMTDDNWETIKLALGKIVADWSSPSTTYYGINTEVLAGKLIVGESVLIESTKQDGSTAVFRVDADGAKLYNSRFDLVSDLGSGQSGHIALSPGAYSDNSYHPIGLVGGISTNLKPLFAEDSSSNIVGVKTNSGDVLTDLSSLSLTDLPNASFWLDMNGNAYFKGTVIAEDGKFSGTVYATDGEFKGTVDASDLKLGGTSISNIFYTSKDKDDPEKDVLHIGNITIDGETGEITFNGSAEIVQVRYSTDKTAIIPSGWSTTWNSSWSNTSTVVYAIYSYDGGSTWTTPMIIQSKNGTNGSDASVPSYITRTKITTTEIESPNITGNYIRALRAFLVGDNYGFMGYAQGAKVDESSLTGTTTTHGVALAASDVMSSADFQNNGGIITYETQGHYIIATTDGVRLQAGSSNLVLTQNGLYLNGAALGAGEGTQVVAVWG